LSDPGTLPQSLKHAHAVVRRPQRELPGV